MKGIKPISVQKEERAVEDDKEESKVKTFKIPAEIFSDFGEISYHNEDLFDFLATHLVINYLEKICLRIGSSENENAALPENEAFIPPKDEGPCWDIAIEFPDCIASMGRSKLHDIGNFFGLAHHSTGSKGKTRRFVLYPKTLFIEK